MINLHSLTIFDISAIVLMIVLAYLSKRLGDALKIKPFYKMLYITALCITSASIFDIVSSSFNYNLPFVSMSLRFIASAGAVFVCLRYWNWLFSEFLRN